ncbi:hypothetical protein GCM10023084_81140 [Streptomyces lacrimifluminis]|uniref:IstB-like ATP-binding domain-containing protein n=1 Tax=Streptomyces lacrimifluminis TaxID=1500077 RepID=A0A917PBB6_9ACTN|nr:hypothetical protein GCM10012282_78300 [Streptomyces lacrimifluminis]
MFNLSAYCAQADSAPPAGRTLHDEPAPRRHGPQPQGRRGSRAPDQQTPLWSTAERAGGGRSRLPASRTFRGEPGLPGISKRYEKNSITLTSNKTVSEWGQVFGDEVLATVILDRLLHHCEVVPINGPSYRLKNRLQVIERETDVA